jgi:hypothetical protein
MATARCEPYSSGRHEDGDYKDPTRAIALAVIAEAVTDWRHAQRHRVLSASVATRWALTEPEHCRLSAGIRAELTGWVADPDGLEFWCDVAGLDPAVVRQAVGA